MLSSAISTSHFQAKPISWSMRTRGSTPRIHTNRNANEKTLTVNQKRPTTTSNDRNSQMPIAPAAMTLNSTKATMSDLMNDQSRLSIQMGSASSSISSGTPKAITNRRPMPRLPGSSAGLIVMCRKSRIGRGSMGAFQPPKNSTTVSADRMNTLTYSAKKKKPK